MPQAIALLASSMSTGDPDAAARLRRAAASLVEQTPMAWIQRIAGIDGAASSGGAARSRRHCPRRGRRWQTRRPPDSPRVGALRVDVLGGLRVTLDGAPLSASGLRPQHRELFAVFCAHADRIVQRDQLLEWFWPDSDPVRAQHSLQVAISELRRLLGSGDGTGAAFGLVREGGGYRLRLAEPSSCDARELERLAESADRGQRSAERTAGLERLTAAAALYRGDLVASVGYPEWVLEERDRLRQVVVRVHEELVRLHAAAGTTWQRSPPPGPDSPTIGTGTPCGGSWSRRCRRSMTGPPRQPPSRAISAC